jgi:hypothetical protein
MALRLSCKPELHPLNQERKGEMLKNCGKEPFATLWTSRSFKSQVFLSALNGGIQYSSRENITIHGDEVVEQTKQQSRFHRNIISRNTGHARLVEIVREWRDSNQYFVEAKVEVGTPEETKKK